MFVCSSARAPHVRPRYVRLEPFAFSWLANRTGILWSNTNTNTRGTCRQAIKIKTTPKSKKAAHIRLYRTAIAGTDLLGRPSGVDADAVATRAGLGRAQRVPTSTGTEVGGRLGPDEELGPEVCHTWREPLKMRGWRSIRFRLITCTCDAPPCGPSARVDALLGDAWMAVAPISLACVCMYDAPHGAYVWAGQRIKKLAQHSGLMLPLCCTCWGGSCWRPGRRRGRRR